MAVAKTICDTVLEELNSHVHSDTQPDPFTAARLRREITKLEQADYMQARLCLGILLTLERKAKQAFEVFEEMLRYTPEDPGLHQNYGHSLAKLRFANLANSHYKAAVEYSPEATEVLIDLAETAQIAFRPCEFMSVLKANIHKANSEVLGENVDVQRAIRLAKLFEDVGISDETANSIYLAAEGLFIEHELLIEAGYFRKTGMYGSSTLTFYAELSCDDDFIHRLNDELCDRLVDFDVAHLLNNLTFLFIAHKPNTKDTSVPNCSMDLKHADH
ncbi:hypothetical protein [Pseudomonas monteilii]|uniref:hypothetical protein n=1 Tax=Pseudomonas monteilii TaxID=76759 RepID=UPI001E35C9F7|nr:hypothetical protein [Pseudomonas monteilii]MCE1007224.1 hypothetical protein [Pseudomonas monteilii]